MFYFVFNLENKIVYSDHWILFIWAHSRLWYNKILVKGNNMFDYHYINIQQISTWHFTSLYP